MILNRRAALGNAQLDELDERIVIRSIDPGVPKENIQAVSRMGGFGQRVTGQHWETLDASVNWAINEPKRELSERRRLFDLVNAWALRRGWLTMTGMDGRRMFVDKVILPGSGDLWNWTAEFTTTFRAYNVPFWQDETPATVTNGNITSGRMTIGVPGMVETVLDAEMKNISGMTIPNISISTGGRTITLNGVNLAGNATLTISHGTDGILRITAGGTSVFNKKTGAGDLIVKPGDNAVDISASRAVRVTLSATGRYV